MGEWSTVPFAEAIDFQEGPGIMAADFRDRGVPLIRLAGLERGGTVLAGCNYLDPSTVAKRWAHFALREGDILLSSSASLGRIAVVGAEAVGAIPYTGIIRMRPRDERVHAPFIRYLLEAPDFQRQAEIAGVGSVMRHFGPMHLRHMTVTLPPLDAQRRIAEILGAIDEKIDLGRRRSETLEAVARALFRSWFVDFHATGTTRPDAWGDGTLADLADLNPEVWQSRDRPSVLRYVDLSGTKWGRIGAVTDYPADQAPSRAQRILRAGDTVVGTVRPGNGSYALVTRDGMTGSTGFAQLRPKRRRDAAFVYLAATARENIDALAHLADGGAYPAVRPHVVAATPVVMPDDGTLQAFSVAVTPFLQRAALAMDESETLGTMRDTLLPRLLSGDFEAA